MIVAAIIVVVGLSMSLAAVQLADLRLSGVLVIPLVALYTLYSFETLPLFIASTALAYAAISVVKRRTLLFRRKLLLTGMVAGAAASVSLASVLTLFDNPLQHGYGVVFVGSILPGIAAYNYHRLDGSKVVEDIAFSGAALVGLLGLGFGLVTPTTAATLGQLTPTVLFSPVSDVAVISDAVVFHAVEGTVFPRGVALLVILLGFTVAEAVHHRWNVRLSGTVTLPLLALFSVDFPMMVLFFAASFAAVFGAVALVNWSTLLYGRVLLTVAVLLGTVLAVPVGFIVSTPGFIVLFTGMFGGIAAYNLHRVAPIERLTAIQLSSGLFASLFVVSWLALTPNSLAAISRTDFSIVAVWVGAVLLAILAVVQLERPSHPEEVSTL
ncbi:poly-gamma-glutamate biosynthesis protein PgsC/CapC [Halobacterium sp. R2-5]|uniref:poly-gamma-glutamate biosynthesis protein PgsC/CapC n=1 Tax=Halobacterium sp. R2-5 TaxID=2715751 RepID=UPI0014239792|nr:poly-gamma-glutamate biosynthesis protein PgsC/CapC [Halobacterium sp. R2-5]NIC01011.1 hypothetical protein [Halobacterium sp. R2-5]